MDVDAADMDVLTTVGIGLGIGKMVIVCPQLTNVEMADMEPAMAEEALERAEPGVGTETLMVAGLGMMMGVMGEGTSVEGRAVEKAEAGMKSVVVKSPTVTGMISPGG